MSLSTNIISDNVRKIREDCKKLEAVTELIGSVAIRWKITELLNNIIVLEKVRLEIIQQERIST